MKTFFKTLCFFVLSNSLYASVVINSGDDFTLALANWNIISSEAKVRQWEIFESKYQNIYDSIIYQKQSPGWETRLAKKREFFFQNLPALQDSMIDLFKNAESIVNSREALFKTMFPDLSDDIPVYVLPSLFSFNGKVADVPNLNRPGLFIGVDFIAYRKDNLDVLFSHEFFHAYHESKLSPDSTGQTMATPLWKEGFATYVSGLLNPTQSEEVLLMDADLTRNCQNPSYVSDLAKLYLPILNTDGETTYGDWFLMNGPNPIKRRGYCLGLQLIRKIAKTNDILDMTTWTEEQFTKVILNVLQEFSSQP